MCKILDRNPNDLADTYVSFALPGAFLGVVVIPGELSLQSAIGVINNAGLNPGGEAIAWHVPEGQYPTMTLLTESYLRSLGATLSVEIDRETLSKIWGISVP